MTAFKIEVRDSEVSAALNRLRDAALRPEPALKAIGELLYRQTRKTFETSTDPWGRRWSPNKPSTIFAMLTKGQGNFRKKDGKLSAKGAGRVVGKRPLIGEGKYLSGPSLHYNVAGNDLTVGSSAIYAAIQQFGGKKSEFPHLWGDLPARPFLPVDQSGNLAPDTQLEIVDIIQDYLLSAIR